MGVLAAMDNDFQGDGMIEYMSPDGWFRGRITHKGEEYLRYLEETPKGERLELKEWSRRYDADMKEKA